jgi:hypothetical protein
MAGLATLADTLQSQLDHVCACRPRSSRTCPVMTPHAKQARKTSPSASDSSPVLAPGCVSPGCSAAARAPTGSGTRGAVDDETRRAVRRAVRPLEQALLRKAEDLELLEQPHAQVVLDRRVAPDAEISVLQRRVVGGDGWDAAEHVDGEALAHERRVEALQARTALLQLLVT